MVQKPEPGVPACASVRPSLPPWQQLLYFWKPLRLFVVLGHYPRTTAIYRNTLTGRRFLRSAPINSVCVDFSINSPSSPQNSWGRGRRGGVAPVCRYSWNPRPISCFILERTRSLMAVGVFTLQMCICAPCWFALWACCPSSSSRSSSPASIYTEDTGSKVEA